MKTVLILDPVLDQAIAVAKYLRKHGKDLRVFACFEDKIRSFSGMQWFDECTIHSYDDPSIVARYDYVVPTGAHSTHKLLSSVESLRVGNVEFTRSNLILYDKLKTLDIAERLGIPTPATFRNIDEIESLPVFYKEPFETGGGIRGIVRTSKKLDSLTVHENLIYQEYINTPTTYGVGFLANKGDIVASFLHKEILSMPKAGGSGVVLERIASNRKLSEYTQRIIEDLGYSGWGLAEFKYCNRRDDFVLMEVNTKFWASLEFALLNNNTFLWELFGIIYHEQNVEEVVFLDRLISLGLLETLRNWNYIWGMYKINVRKMPGAFIHLFSRMLIPHKVRDWIRKSG